MPTTPFSTSPNPTLLYQTAQIRATLAKIRFVVDYRQGLTALLGDVGMGKSTLLRLLHLEYELREDSRAILIPTPNYPSDFALLKGICREFGAAPKRSMTEQQDELTAFLFGCLERGTNTVVFIDEAQKLTTKMLELVRTLLNLETNDMKLIQIVLAGQLELRDRLNDPRQRAIRRRVLTPSLMDPLSPDETAEMIAFRCRTANVPNLFTADALTALYAETGGVPSLVLQVCMCAWEAALALDLRTIGAAEIRLALDAVRLE